MDRHRARLTAALVLAAALPILAACTTDGSPVGTPPTTTSVARVDPTGAGYPVAKGRTVEIAQGQTGTVTLAIGDVLAVHRPTTGTRPGGNALILAEVNDTQLIYQAVAAGRSSLATDDPPPAPSCPTTPCPPGRAAPPVLMVEVGYP